MTRNERNTMTTRRRLLVLGLLAGLLVLGGGVWLLWESVETESIRPGMMLDEVIEILDRPDGMISTTHGGSANWHRKRGIITVSFDGDFVVTGVQREPLFERVRRWTGF
jgi:hypothetical protein